MEEQLRNVEKQALEALANVWKGFASETQNQKIAVLQVLATVELVKAVQSLETTIYHKSQVR